MSISNTGINPDDLFVQAHVNFVLWCGCQGTGPLLLFRMLKQQGA